MNNPFEKISNDTLEAAKRGDTESLLKNLNQRDRQTIENIIADKDKLNKILTSDTAKQLMKILGGNKNG